MATFRAMGTEVTVQTPGRDEERATALVELLFRVEERRFSRFDERSELSALNRSEGPFALSAAMHAALRAALAWYESTAGLFDPCVGGTLRAIGYDRSFAPGALDDEAPASQAPRGSLAELRIDAFQARRPAHLHVDLGGLIKGRTVDRAARLLGSVHPGEPLVVEAGGDAALVGDPDGDGWLVDVEDPFNSERTLLTVRAHDCGVATSAPNRRAWRRGGEAQHHLVDPRMACVSSSDLAQVTVLAPTTEEADVMAKVIFLLGEREGMRLAASKPALAVIAVRKDGRVRTAGELKVTDG